MKAQTLTFGETGVVITLEGELDLYSTNDLRVLSKNLIQDGRMRIVLDVNQLTYLDSSGVGFLIYLLQTLRTKKGRLLIVGLGGTPKKVLEMSGIIQLMTQCPSVEEGIALAELT